MRAKAKGRPLVAPTSGRGGAKRAVIGGGGEGKGSVRSVEVGGRRKKGF